MKISYVTTYDAQDVHNWSGIGYYMAKSFEEQFIDVHYVGNLTTKYETFQKISRRLYRTLLGKTHLADRNNGIARHYADQIKQRLKDVKTDVIFSPGSVPVSMVEDKRPIVFWTDATFNGMVDFYPGFSHLTADSMKYGHSLEQAALTKCSLAIYSSDWAAQTALQYYDIDPGKVKVVPFGANLDGDRSLELVKANLSRKSGSVCKLLFLGVEWDRKGGDVAFAVTRRLNEMGVPAELLVAGCTPKIDGPMPGYVKPLGFISKSTVAGIDTLQVLLATSHFLMLPTKADCAPMVFAEANSMGLPVITSNVGGIPTLIRDDLNGKMFGLDSAVDQYARFIADVHTDAKRYQELCLSSFNEYETRLNWNVAAQTVKGLLSALQ
ncbi:glycosyltransferase family 4 protein [Larkinella terrae]|uniref:Glycosyltransferase n=1 Tax=Larkinella terrae TaxID=2025311 RepID=A0A7K0EG56_9BACT|nr:glycosyltransferase family 4 protein [Larkinella terrae]MRS60840.1 glycosyltransferase [Larkinella terrae]